MIEFFQIGYNIASNLSYYLLTINMLLLVLVAIYMVFTSNLFRLIILLAVFSILASLAYLFMDAPDVAMTEMALGAALSSCVWLNVILITRVEDNKTKSYFRVVISIAAALLLIWFLLPILNDLPAFGTQDAPLHQGVSNYYLHNTMPEIGISSVVSAILASYRGYDTLGETTVILLAAIGVLMIMKSRKNDV